jgi:prepilin-type N-terminal cleavage/methylation domain-containing protein
MLIQRRGFTLVEMILATSLLLMVSGTLYSLLLGTQRLARSQSQHLRLQSEVRNAMLVALNELQELNTAQAQGSDQNDVLSATSSGLTYRASRGFGLTCQPGSATQLRLARAEFSGARDPVPGRDSVLVLTEPDTAAGAEEVWQPSAITAVSNAVCPGSVPGIAVSLPATGSLLGVSLGTPVKIYEVMELKLYQSTGQWWVGLRSVSTGEAIQPLAGPVTADGLRFEFLDRFGQPTADRTSVRSIHLEVQGRSEQYVDWGGVDTSLTQQLGSDLVLRNSVGP